MGRYSSSLVLRRLLLAVFLDLNQLVRSSDGRVKANGANFSKRRLSDTYQGDWQTKVEISTSAAGQPVILKVNGDSQNQSTTTPSSLAHGGSRRVAASSSTSSSGISDMVTDGAGRRCHIVLRDHRVRATVGREGI